MRVRTLSWTIAVTAVYVGAAKIGLSLAFLHANVSPVWPPTGVAIAALLWLGYRMWPAILLGALIANLPTDVPLATAAGIAAGNTLEAVSAAFLINRFVGSRNPLERATDVWKFALIAGLLSPMVGASIGNSSLCLGGAAQWANFSTLWLTWWLGDGSGALIVAPFLLSWLERTSERWPAPRLIEATLLLFVLTAIASMTFGGFAPTRAANYPLGHLTIPILLWAAFRFGPRGAATAIVILSSIATLGTTRGLGPFVYGSLNESLLLLQVFLVVVSIAALVLAGKGSEHKRAQRELAFLASIVESSDDAVIGRTTSGTIASWNKGAARIFGYSAEEMIGRHISVLLPRDRLDEHARILGALKSGQPTEHYETVRVRKDGTLINVSLTVSPIRDAAGRTVAASVIARDITERRRAEEALRSSEDRLRAILDNSTAFVYLKDLDGRYLLMNRRGLQTWGFDWKDVQGKTDYEIYAKEVAEVYVRNDRNVLEQRAPIQYEEPGFEPDGPHSYLSVKFPLLDAAGNPYAICGISTDISDLKRVEQEREHLLVREQTARAAAETANRAKDEFLALVSHELRTPLNAIVGWVEILLNARPNETLTDHALLVIKRNADLQVRIVEDILDVSRIVAGKLKLELRPLDITGVIHAALAVIQPMAEAKNIHIRATLPERVDPVLGDGSRLQQVVWNLLSNAIKFTPDGGEVAIALQQIGLRVSITVRDTGEGIPASFLPHIFDRFSQADSSRTRRHGGLGLGLAIVRHFVELHGGTVEARSEGEFRGAVFTVNLPCAHSESRLLQQQTWAPRAGAADDSVLRGIKVLIVDDDVDSRQVLAATLGIKGAEAKTVANARDALEAWDKWAPNVLISDIGLPEQDGYYLIKQLRSRENEEARIPAIALTGYASIEDRDRALDAGYQLHLAKPVDSEQLISLVARLGRLNGARRESDL